MPSPDGRADTGQSPTNQPCIHSGLRLVTPAPRIKRHSNPLIGSTARIRFHRVPADRSSVERLDADNAVRRIEHLNALTAGPGGMALLLYDGYQTATVQTYRQLNSRNLPG